MAGPSYDFQVAFRLCRMFDGTMDAQPPKHLWSTSARLMPMAGGARASVLRTSGLDPDLVFKTTARSAEALCWLLPVHDAARAAGFVVPKLRPTVSGDLVAEGWTCEDFLVGSPLARSDLPEIAPLLARFHARTRGMPQRPGFLSSQDLDTRTSGGDIDFTAMPAQLANRIRFALRALPAHPTCVIHGDITPANVLRLPDGRFGLLDWDETRRDLPLFDFQLIQAASDIEARACLAWEIACCWQGEPQRARKLAASF